MSRAKKTKRRKQQASREPATSSKTQEKSKVQPGTIVEANRNNGAAPPSRATQPPDLRIPVPASKWLRLLAVAVSGASIFLATANFDIWPLAWIGFLPLFWVLSDTTAKGAFLWGWLAGTITNFGGFYWVPDLLERFGHLPTAAAWPLAMLLYGYQGLNYGLFAWALHRARRDPRARLPLALLAPVFMVGAELITPMIFPWYLAITQAWIVPVIQVADLGGPYAVTTLIMLVNGVLYDAFDAWRHRRSLPMRPIIAGAVILATALIYGQIRIVQVDAKRKKAPSLQVGIVQGNIGIVSGKTPRVRLRHHGIYLRESQKLQRDGAQLLVWPESAYPFVLLRDQWKDFPSNDGRQVMRGLKVPLLFGALSWGHKDPYPYNSAYLMTPDGKIQGRFDKNFLMIFGEYIPFYDSLKVIKKWFPATNNFARGREVTTFPLAVDTEAGRARESIDPSKSSSKAKIGPLICYEDIIPEFTRRVAKLRPNLLVNVTNDAWFGDTSEPWQHLALSVFRAVELRLDLVRSVNTGVSAFIDANGRMLANTKAYDPHKYGPIPPVTLMHRVRSLQGSKTVYTEIGDLFAYLMLGAGILLLLVPFVRARRRRQTGAKADVIVEKD
jgi:apolipoprotein N-acyltransferase